VLLDKALREVRADGAAERQRAGVDGDDRLNG
jgi:hypothetical protein